MIGLTISDGVAQILLDRPDKINAINPPMMQAFGEALDAALAGGARAVLVSGAGRGFCSGADLTQDGPAPDPDELAGRLERVYNPVVARLASLPVPVVTAVHGAAAGAGCSLALAGDFCVAGESAFFQLAFVRIALVPDCGASWFVSRAAGRARALAMAMTGERIPAAEAERWGLIHKVVPDAALPETALSLARALAQGPTEALLHARAAIDASLSATLEETLLDEAQRQRDLLTGADHREGVAAFREKRAPRFGI